MNSTRLIIGFALISATLLLGADARSTYSYQVPVKARSDDLGAKQSTLPSGSWFPSANINSNSIVKFDDAPSYDSYMNKSVEIGEIDQAKYNSMSAKQLEDFAQTMVSKYAPTEETANQYNGAMELDNKNLPTIQNVAELAIAPEPSTGSELAKDLDLKNESDQHKLRYQDTEELPQEGAYGPYNGQPMEIDGVDQNCSQKRQKKQELSNLLWMAKSGAKEKSKSLKKKLKDAIMIYGVSRVYTDLFQKIKELYEKKKLHGPEISFKSFLALFEKGSLNNGLKPPKKIILPALSSIRDRFDRSLKI